MHKIYLLLRDNKESGPYSLDELLERSLRPFDLIWVEGRSAGWQYPAEIESLRSFVPAPQAPQKKESRTQQNSSPSPAPSPAAPARAKVKASAPAVPSTGKHIYVSFPAGSPAALPMAAARASSEPSPEDQLERKAEAIRARVQAFSEGKKEVVEEVQTNYTRSLDEMKEEYASWVFRQKTKQKRGTLLRKAGLVVLLALLLAAGTFLFGKELVTAPQNERQAAKEATETPAIRIRDLATNELPAVRDDNREHEPALLAASSNLSPPVVETPVPAPADNTGAPAAAAKNTYIPKKSKVSSSGTALTKTPHRAVSSAVITLPVIIPDISAATAPPLPIPTTSEKATPTATSKKVLNLPAFIKVNENYVYDSQKGLDGDLQITVQNNSSQNVNMVEVDVFYYRKDKSLLQKKTLRFTNLPAEKSVSRLAPRLKKADSIESRVALISTNGGMHYLR